MKNFARTLRLALRYRWTVAATVASSLAVAVLWGGNIGTLYPLVEVTFQGQSLSQWVDGQIRTAERTSAEFERAIAGLQKAQAASTPEERPGLESQVAFAQSRLAAEQQALARYRWLKAPIDRYLPNDPFRTLVVIMAVLVIGTIVKDVFLAISQILVERLANLAAFDLRKKFYRRTLRMDMASFADNGTSDLLSRFTYDLDGIAGGVQTLFGRAIREPLKMLACFIGAALVSWQLLLLSLVTIPFAVYLVLVLAKTLRRANRRAMEQMSSLYNILVETFGGIKVVKAFAMERQERRRFHVACKNTLRRSMRISVLDGLVGPVTEFMGISTICLAILAGGYLALNHETHLLGIRMSDRPLTLGSLFVFYGMLAGVSDPVRKLTEVFNRLQRAAAASDRVYQLLDREPTVRDAPRPAPLARHHADLVFENVHFRYRPDNPVLENINLRIECGEAIAIVGPNGCGKSTLANLVLRFFDPVEGSVRIDGIDLREARMRDLRRQIGIVAQETLLFDDTVLNNIRYGKPSATRDEVIAAARQAHAHKFITERLEQGYETVVGAHGGRLSGGQRQRIALARAILRDPAILILDEATSQVDLESEQLIHRVLEQFVRRRTTLLITHRMSTLALADRIVVMESGRILDVGTHSQLMARCELFRRLNELQFRQTG